MLGVMYGVLPLLGYDAWDRWIGWHKIPTEESYVYLLFGIILFYIAITIKESDLKYSKCPKCKESYDYYALNKGVCPTCNIKTIDLDIYFEKFPEELKNV